MAAPPPAATAAAAAATALSRVPGPCCRPAFLDTDSVALPENFCIIESPESVKVRVRRSAECAAVNPPLLQSCRPPG